MSKRFLRVMMVVGFMVFGGSSADTCDAFEAGITKGSFDWSYSYLCQGGSNGFFGPFDVSQDTLGGDLAPLNGWVGTTIVSGTSSGVSRLTVLLEPYISLNPAVNIRAGYVVGPYNIATVPGASNIISTGGWRWWYLEAETPWGLVYYGKRRFGRGLGLQFGTTRTEEFIGLDVTILSAPESKWMSCMERNHLKSKCYQTDPEEKEVCERDEEIRCLESERASHVWTRGAGIVASPTLKVGFGAYPFRRGSTEYWDSGDLNAGRQTNLTAYMRLESTLAKFDTGIIYTAFSEGPEAMRTAAERLGFPRTDTTVSEGWIYFGLNSARFSWYSEFDWYYSTVRYQRSADGTFRGTRENTDGRGSVFVPNYIESWRFCTEFKASYGPALLSVLYVRMPGPDRRHGIRIDRQPFVQQVDQRALETFSDYSSIMAGTYSGGVDAFGDIPDASTIGVRLEYYLAANLNAYTRWLAATRVSQGYGWGYIRPATTAARFGQVDFGVRGDFANPSPAIPDNNLGWEVGAGFEWELLEGWSVLLDVDYWKPGRWFNYACADKSVSNWNLPTAANNFGVNPERTIDPVWTANLTLTGSF